MYKITVHPARNLVEARIAGLLSVDEVRRYSADLQAHFAEGGLMPDYLMLVDVSAASIQPQEVVAAFQQHVSDMPRARRLVVVTGSSAIRMQMRRVLQETGIAAVATRKEAITLLLKPRSQRAA